VTSLNEAEAPTISNCGTERLVRRRSESALSLDNYYGVDVTEAEKVLSRGIHLRSASNAELLPPTAFRMKSTAALAPVSFRPKMALCSRGLSLLLPDLQIDTAGGKRRSVALRSSTVSYKAPIA